MNNLLLIAKEVIEKHHKKNMAVDFKELWKKTAANAKIKNPNNDDLISEFYIAILEDPNFIKINDNEWTLKKFHTFSEVEKMSSPIYATEEFEVNEGNYEEFMSKYEISELKHKGRNSETAAMELDEIENVDDDENMLEGDDLAFDEEEEQEWEEN